MVGGRGRDHYGALRPVLMRVQVGRAIPAQIPGQIPLFLRLVGAIDLAKRSSQSVTRALLLQRERGSDVPRGHDSGML